MNHIVQIVILEVIILTKAQKEKAERLMLKQMLDTNPKLKAFIDALIDKPDVKTKDIV